MSLHALHPHRIEHQGIRRAARVSFTGDVAVREADGCGELVLSATDISAVGMFLRSELFFEEGTRLRVAFQLPDGFLVVATATVARIAIEAQDRSRTGMGIAFTEIADEAVSRILKLRGTHDGYRRAG